MDADYSVELGRDDPALEMPWSDPDGRVKYHDLRAHPEALLHIDEAMRYRELGQFLVAINSMASALDTAKCDVWSENDLGESEEIYGGRMKLASYVDLIFRDRDSRFDLALHERFAKRSVELLHRAPDLSCAAEFVIRRCYFHEHAQEVTRLRVEGREDLQDDVLPKRNPEPETDSAPGFYFTFYLSGYGADEAEARLRWSVGLNLVQNALLQIAAEWSRAEK